MQNGELILNLAQHVVFQMATLFDNLAGWLLAFEEFF